MAAVFSDDDLYDDLYDYNSICAGAGYWTTVPAFQAKIPLQHRQQPYKGLKSQLHICLSESGISTHQAAKAAARSARCLCTCY